MAQLSQHFDSYQQVPKISELRGRFAEVKAVLRAAIVDDFSAVHALSEAGGSLAVRERLQAACQVVDALGPAVREDLVAAIADKELLPYRQIFQGTGGEEGGQPVAAWGLGR